MLIKAKELKNYKLSSLDGEIGTVKEFYFDDNHWNIRYLIANTGNWLTGRQVLISSYALLAVNNDEELITVNLTKSQIENSPSLNSDEPVSKQFQEDLYGYYEWPVYWGGLDMWTPCIPYNLINGGQAALNGVTKTEDEGDPNLRSTHNVSGYVIQALDGEIGHVEDFIMDDDTWKIRYLIIDTQNWWQGKKILISPQWIDHISWDESKVFITLLIEAIKHSPEYTEMSVVNRHYETILHQNYNRKGYWLNEAEIKNPKIIKNGDLLKEGQRNKEK